jgi:hypothetical protein
MSARIEPERQRVLAAIKPTQGGSPLPAIRAGEFAQRVDGDLLLVGVGFDSLVAGGFEGAAALDEVAKSRLIEDQNLELERTAQSLRDRGGSATVRVVCASLMSGTRRWWSSASTSNERCCRRL